MSKDAKDDSVASTTTNADQPRPFLNRNLFTILALGLIALVGAAVPQVKNLFELPNFTGGESNLAIFFYAYVVCLIATYIILGWWVVPIRFREDKNKQHKLGDRISSGIRQKQTWLIVATLGIGVIVFLMIYFPNRRWVSPFGTPFLVSMLQLAICLFAVLLFWNKMDRRTQLLWLRILAVIITLNFVGEFIWYLSISWDLSSPRNYTLWAILHTAFCVVLFARVVDYWSGYSHWIRPIAVLLVLIVVGQMPAKNVGKQVALKNTSGPTGGDEQTQEQPVDPWLSHLRARLRSIPKDDRPVVMIAASGGGSRAALFTALVLEDFERADITVPNEDAFKVSDHVLLVSSVSGGTLASACYVDQEYKDTRIKNGTRERPRNFMLGEISELLRADDNLLDLKQIPWCTWPTQRDGAEEQTYYQLVEEALKSDDPNRLWFLRRAYVDDMCTDFMAPLLRGALHMPVGRGQSVRQFWEFQLGLTKTNRQWQEEAAEFGTEERDQPVPPLLFCNVSEVARGTRVIVGFPPLPTSLLVSEDETRATRGWVNLDPSGQQFVELKLSEAVRLSANFPWGFPIAEANVDGVEDQIHLIDGGVVDNTGIDAIRSVFQKLHHWTQFDDSSTPTVNQKVAREIFDELHRRSVLVIEIDSGAKPRQPGWVSAAFSGVLEPVSALENAAYANANAAVQTHLHYLQGYLPSTDISALRRRLRAITDSDLPTPSRDLGVSDQFPRVKKLKITCNHQENVMTAWALGPNDKATIFLRFLAGSERLHDQIGDHIEQRSILLAFEEFVQEQEAIAKADPEKIDLAGVKEAIENLDALAFFAEATQKKQDLASQLETMYYQKMPLPFDSEQLAIDTLPVPELSTEMFGEQVTELAPIGKTTGLPEQIGEIPVNDLLPSKEQYEKVDAVIRQYDTGLKSLQGELRRNSIRFREKR